MTKISIIVPIYNVDKYLEECLDSLLNQSLKDIEILCIDDGSTDSSSKILKKYSILDKRIRVITQPSMGQGIARNNAIAIAKGEYIGFVDPDDFVSPKMYETLYKNAKLYDVDLVESSYLIYNEARKYIKKKKNKLKLPVNKKFNWEIRKNYLFSPSLVVWNKLYRTDFIKKNKLQFMNVLRGEDVIFTVKSRALAKDIIYIEDADYKYRQKEDNSIIINQDLVAKISVNRFEYFKMFKQSLIESDIYEMIEKDYIKWVIQSLIDDYQVRKLQNKKNNYIKQVYNFLNLNEFILFLFKLCGQNIKDNIFCIRNYYIDDKKYKNIKILGINFRILYNKLRVRNEI